MEIRSTKGEAVGASVRVRKLNWLYAVLVFVAIAALAPGIYRLSSTSSSHLRAAMRALNTPDTKLDRGLVQTWRKVPRRISSNLSWLAPVLAVEKRLKGAATLARFGPAAAPAASSLVHALNDLDPRVARATVVALGAIGPAANDAVPSLLWVFNGNSTNILSQATPEVPLALAQIAPENLDVVEALLRRARDPAISPHIAPALSELARSSPHGLRVWQEVAKTQTVFVEPMAPPGTNGIVLSLSGLPGQGISFKGSSEWRTKTVRTEPSSSAVPQVADALLENPHVSALDRVNVACALIESQRPERLNCGLGMVQRMGPQAAAAVPSIVTALNREREKLRRFSRPPRKAAENSVGALALRALGAIGPAGQEALPALSAICDNWTDPLRFEAALARCRIDGNCAAAMSVLSVGCRDQELDTREIAFSTVVKLAKLCNIDQELLIIGMRDPEHGIRQLAIHALPKTRPLPPSLQESLTRLLSDPHYGVRNTATNTVLGFRTGLK